MNLLSLDITNFLAIGHARLAMKNQGLVLLQGENLDDTSANSNGVGKSSIPDALCWCVYGETAREESGDDVVNDKAKKGTVVTCIWEDGTTRYRIARHRKHPTFKNETHVEQSTDAGATWTTLTKGTEKETQKVILDIIGCSYDVFRASIYSGQESMPDLPNMTDKQLKLLVEEASGVERLEGAYRIAADRLAERKREHVALTTKRDGLASQLESAKVALASRKIEHDRFEEGRPERAKIHHAQAAEVRASIIEAAGKLKGAGEAEKGARAAEIAKQLSEHSRSERAVQELALDVTDALKILTTAKSRCEHGLAEVRRRKDALDNIAEEATKPCPECGKPHTEAEIEDLRRHMTDALRQKIIEAKELQGKVAEAQARHDAAVAKVREAQAKLPDVSHLTAEQAAINRDLMALERLKAQVLTRKKDFDRLVELAKSELTATNPYAAAIADADTRVKTLLAGIDDLNTQIAFQEVAVEVAANVAKVFSPAGVRAHILDTVTPFLNDRTADYLSALSDGNIEAVWTTLGQTSKGELREKFNIAVKNSKGAKSFKGLSGGEKRKVRLATALALQDLVASRATKNLGLWIGDEIDGALDRAGLERLMVILERKARERGTVIVVSHHDLKDWCDNVCIVTKQPDGIAVVSGALCV